MYDDKDFDKTTYHVNAIKEIEEANKKLNEQAESLEEEKKKDKKFNKVLFLSISACMLVIFIIFFIIFTNEDMLVNDDNNTLENNETNETVEVTSELYNEIIAYLESGEEMLSLLDIEFRDINDLIDNAYKVNYDEDNNSKYTVKSNKIYVNNTETELESILENTKDINVKKILCENVNDESNCYILTNESNVYIFKNDVLVKEINIDGGLTDIGLLNHYYIDYLPTELVVFKSSNTEYLYNGKFTQLNGYFDDDLASLNGNIFTNTKSNVFDYDTKTKNMKMYINEENENIVADYYLYSSKNKNESLVIGNNKLYYNNGNDLTYKYIIDVASVTPHNISLDNGKNIEF